MTETLVAKLEIPKRSLLREMLEFSIPVYGDYLNHRDFNIGVGNHPERQASFRLVETAMYFVKYGTYATIVGTWKLVSAV